jgi:hypothetical protein
MGWAEQRAKKMMVPWDEDTPNAKGFWNYVEEYYRECLSLANKIVFPKKYDSPVHWKAMLAVFDKLASPLVYLWEAWEVLPPEKKAKYNPELAKIHEESVKLAEKAFAKS